MSKPERPPLGAVSLFTLGLNGIVGVGIFVAPPLVARAIPGTRGTLLYVAMALGCLPIALVYARLARALPKDGGPVLWAGRAFGPRVASAVGVLNWVSSVFSTAATTRALGDVLAEPLHRPKLALVLAPAITLVLLFVNLRGLRPSAIAWTVLTVLKIIPLAVVASLGLAHLTHAEPAALGTRADFGTAALVVLFALQGFEIVPLPAGQARDPQRTVPRATVAALVVAGVLYAAIHHGCAVSVPSLASTTTPIPDAARALGGPVLAWSVGAGVVVSITGIVVGSHAMTPRYLSAVMHPERSVLVDVQAIVLSAILIGAFSALGSLATLVNLSSASVIGQYATTTLALLVLAARRRESVAPRDAWPAPIALVVLAALLLQAHLRELAVAGSVAILGAVAVPLLRRGRSAPS